jgi:hypothetical protein
MAKLLQLSRPSSGVSNVARTWWAMRSQKRRRRRAGGGVLPAPINLGGTWDAADVWLSWEYPSGGENGFRIYRNGVLYGTSPAGMTAFDDGALTVGAHYVYFVVAFDARGESAPSNQFSVTI